MHKKVVFDFDKTLVNTNTFPFWIGFVLMFSWVRFEFKREVLKLLFQRKISKNLSHHEFKKQLIQVQLDDVYYSIFAKIMVRFSNKKSTQALMQLYNQGYPIAISSAAPENYLNACIQEIFPNKSLVVIGAHVHSNEFTSNYKNEKYANLIKKDFISPNDKLAYFFTDSLDDFHLAQFSEKVILVNPDQKTVQKFLNESKSEVSIL